MIKLKKEVNKSVIMRELRKKADKIYENSWEREYTIEKFIEGAEHIFNLLRLPVVSNSSKAKTNKNEPITPYSEWNERPFNDYTIENDRIFINSQEGGDMRNKYNFLKSYLYNNFRIESKIEDIGWKVKSIALIFNPNQMVENVLK